MIKITTKIEITTKKELKYSKCTFDGENIRNEDGEVINLNAAMKNNFAADEQFTISVSSVDTDIIEPD